MSSDPNDSSFDLDQARRLSQRLRGGGRPAAPPSGPRGPSAEQGYVRFVARKVDGYPEAPRPASHDGFGEETWNDFLDECIAQTRAASAFLMDAQGLVVACRGDRSASELEGIGARLMVMLEQADKMRGASTVSESVCIELDAQWLTGLRARLDGGRTMTLGVIAPAPLQRDARERLEAGLARAINTAGHSAS